FTGDNPSTGDYGGSGVPTEVSLTSRRPRPTVLGFRVKTSGNPSYCAGRTVLVWVRAIGCASDDNGSGYARHDFGRCFSNYGRVSAHFIRSHCWLRRAVVLCHLTVVVRVY